MVLLFGSYVGFQLDRLAQIIHLAAGANNQVIQISDDLSTRLGTLVALEKKYWISKDHDFYQLFLKRKKEFLSQIEALKSLVTGAGPKDLVKKATDFSRSYFRQVENRAKWFETAPSGAYASERDERVDALAKVLDQIGQAGLAAKNENILKLEAISARVLRVAIGFALASILSGLAVSFLTTRRIVRPIVVLQQNTRKIADGRFVILPEMKAPQEIRHLAEDFNVMSARLKELDTLKEDFVSHVSHSLRTPLTAMREASDMLIRGTFDSDPQRRGQLLNIMRDECRRLITAVNRILDLSRMESGLMEYRFEEVDLNDLVLSSVSKFGPMAQMKSIRLHFEPARESPLVNGDREQLTQLMENLIGNALKFTDIKGRVTISVRGPGDGLDRVQVAVIDNGCGIEPQHLEKIFDKFHRIEKKENTVRGTGLGLAIAKHIVNAHGGTIWVQSKIGSGSEFCFSLPQA